MLSSCNCIKQGTNKKNTTNYEWFDYKWESGTLSGKYFPKLAMLIPTKINNLDANLELQFDLGSNTSVLYGNTLGSYFPKSTIKSWLIDSTKISPDENRTFYQMQGINITSGDFKIEHIVYMENFGTKVLKDSLFTSSPKRVGSLGADAFKDKILIIDYPNQRMCVLDSLDRFWKSKAVFVQSRLRRGRIQIPLTINNKDYWFLFDTGASLFPVNTNKKIWTEIVDEIATTDTLIANSWGEQVPFYGKPITKNVYLGDKLLHKDYAWYNENKRLMEFNTVEEIDGLVGNAYFFDEVVLLDFKHNQFGVVRK